MDYTIECLSKPLLPNHWRILRSDGAILGLFATREQAEVLLEFFNVPKKGG